MGKDRGEGKRMEGINEKGVSIEVYGRKRGKQR